LSALTLPAAREIDRCGIRVVTIAPGILRDAHVMGMPQPVQDSIAPAIPYPSRWESRRNYAGLAMHISAT